MDTPPAYLPSPVASPPPPSPPPPRRWPARALRLLAAGAVIGGVLVQGAAIFVGLAALFVLLTPLEKIWRRHPYKLRRPGLATDIGYLLAAPVLGAVAVGVALLIAVTSLAWLPGLLLRSSVRAQPFWAQALEAVVAFDLIGYWAHRAAHEVPVLWRFHSVHHSSERLDWIAGARTHPLDGVLVAAAPAVVLLAAGLNPAKVGGAFVVVRTVTGLWAHLNVRWRLRPLHRIVLTPEFHHWHHANEPGAINTNYAGLLPLWDILFGTYRMPADRRPQVYGISAPMPASMAGQLASPFLRVVPAA